LIPGRGRDLSVLKSVQTRSEASTTSPSADAGSGYKVAEYEASHSRLCSTEASTVWSCTSTPTCAFMICTWLSIGTALSLHAYVQICCKVLLLVCEIWFKYPWVVFCSCFDLCTGRLKAKFLWGFEYYQSRLLYLWFIRSTPHTHCVLYDMFQVRILWLWECIGPGM
jgi:hypothetical protein